MVAGHGLRRNFSRTARKARGGGGGTKKKLRDAKKINCSTVADACGVSTSRGKIMRHRRHKGQRIKLGRLPFLRPLNFAGFVRLCLLICRVQTFAFVTSLLLLVPRDGDILRYVSLTVVSDHDLLT